MYKIIGADGNEYGPVSSDVVRQWLRQGRLHLGSKVRLETETEWVLLASLPEFAAQPSNPPLPIAPPNMPERTSGLAITSLVLGILGLVSCGVTAVAGLIFGIVGWKKIKHSDGQLGGSGLAIAGMVVSGVFMLLMVPLMAALLLPALAKAKAKAQMIQCVNNTKQITLGVLLYADSNTNFFPNAATWCDDVLPEVMSSDVFLCPAGNPQAKCHYAYNENLAGIDLDKVANPATTVMIFEAESGWNGSGGGEALLPMPRHDRKVVVGFVDGHVEMLDASQLSHLNWEP